jgi:diadenosine tetraphosphatase ApaH/serine/threonine PP2A family protein phosphatase
VCLGDVATLGVAPGEVVDTLERIGCRCITGNHDDYLFDPSLVAAHNDSPMIADAIDWCREQLSPAQLEFVRGFEAGIELPLAGDHRLRLFHGSPSSNTVDLLADTPADLFDAQLGPERATVMAGGHTHLQMMRQHRGILLVNPGSVGMPFREYAQRRQPVVLKHAEYAIVSAEDGVVGVELRRVPVDLDALCAAIAATDHPLGPMLLAAYRA